MEIKRITKKKCRKCEQIKSTSDFYRSGHGYSAWCKSCHQDWSKHQAKSGYFKERRDQIRESAGLPKRILLTPIERAAEALWRNAQKRSSRNGKAFNLERKDVERMVGEFCGSNHFSFGKRDPFRPSLDKINPSLGYSKENIRVIWLIENYAKNTFTEDQLIEFCKRKLGLI